MKIKSFLKYCEAKVLGLVSVMVLLLGPIVACSKVSSDEYLKQAQDNLEKNEFQTAVINLKMPFNKTPKILRHGIY